MELKTTIWRTSGGGNGRMGLFGRDFQPSQASPNRLQAQGGVRASAIFDRHGNVYIADMAGGVQSFGPGGSKRWSITLPVGVSASPALDTADKRLFAGTLDGRVYALDPSNGDRRWETRIPSQSDPRILSDLLHLPKRGAVVLNSWGGRFHALDEKNGDLLISWDAGISPYASAAALEDETLFALRAVWSDNKAGVEFVQVDPKSGEETERFFQAHGNVKANRLAVAASPVIDESRGVLYFITNIERKGILHAQSISSGETTWSRPFKRFLTATPALLADGSVVIADLDGMVHVLSPEGNPRYRYHTGAEYLLASPVCDRQGRVFIGDPEGRVHIIEPGGVGRILFDTERSIQARAAFSPDGRLYLPSMDGNVYVFST